MSTLMHKEPHNKSTTKPTDYSYNISKMPNENNKNPTPPSRKSPNFSRNPNNPKTPSALKSDNKLEIDS